MIWDQGPGKASRSGLCNSRPQTFEKIIAVAIIVKNLAPPDPSGNDVMQRAGRVDAGLSWHMGRWGRW